MNCNPIPEREDWFITDRKPTICPRCKKKEVRKALGNCKKDIDGFDSNGFQWTGVHLVPLPDQ